ncbi:MAG: GGDEF domain-containing protein [Desulfobacterales bacterium]|nr:MAG: GGDEF domain-containing protein [Desulfobacterales bacterium]
MLKKLYPESNTTSSKHLRQVLQSIAEHDLPYNPIVYAVWYEYATGRTPELNTIIDESNNSAEPISLEMVTEWFETFIATHQIRVTEKTTNEFKSIIFEVSKQIDDSGSRIADSGDRIKILSSQMDPAQPKTIEEVSQSILSETHSILKENHSLKQDMDATINEIDALKRELEGVRQAAKTDTLTGLLNRRGFDEAFIQASREAQENNTPLTIVLCDIDHFKQVNDTHGHLIGDNVLKMLAKLLHDHIKGKDIAARFGGEEFILILPDTDIPGGVALAEQMRKSLQKKRWRSKTTGETIGPITISLGIALYRPKEDVEALVQRADDALYVAKNNGRNRTITEENVNKS